MRPVLAILALSLSACGSPEAASTEAAPTAPVAAAEPAAEAAPAAPAAEAAPAAPAGPTVAGLYEGWSATDARIGTEITLAGTFGNAMSGGGHVRSVSVVVSSDDMRSVWCELVPETAPEHVTLMGYHSPITVRGTLADDHGRPSLTSCLIVE
ncbi:MAG: hypothetical protein U0234_31430 [Sandaracinus sp.]